MESKLIYSDETTKVKDLQVDDFCLRGVEVAVPGRTSWAIIIRCKKGMLACRLLHAPAADKIELPIAIIGALDSEDMLKNKPVALSDAALALGATMEMTGAEIARIFEAE